jgi:dolichyl-phosphate-mannose--protein O-mannosyl transferase
MGASDRPLVVLLLVLGLFTRFACLNYPREVVWDEFHFGERRRRPAPIVLPPQR